MQAEKIRIALIAEKKNPPDQRVAFSPEQCLEIQKQYPQIEFLIEPSTVRCIPDNKYVELGLKVQNDISGAAFHFGIKEVPVDSLLEGKTYFFFSHTIKKQAHNRKLLQALLKKKIEMVDYECLVDQNGNRTVAFGRFAGIVGAYNALRMWILKYRIAALPPASACRDMEEMMEKVRPHLIRLSGLRIAVTGTGRVGSGAIEVLEKLGIKRIDADTFTGNSDSEAVYTVLSSRHYLKNIESAEWNENHFRSEPASYQSNFLRFAACTDILISCHFWNPKAPALFTIRDIMKSDFRISVISDVTCDIGGSVPTTIRASSISDPFYDIGRSDAAEKPAFSNEGNISVCAVDNLPCELPFDASVAFGKMLKTNVIPELISSIRPGIEGATICREGELCSKFDYLQDFANQIEL